MKNDIIATVLWALGVVGCIALVVVLFRFSEDWLRTLTTGQFETLVLFALPVLLTLGAVFRKLFRK